MLGRNWGAVLLAALLLTSFAAAPAHAGEWHEIEQDEENSWFVTVKKMPTSVDEYKALRDEMCTTAHGALVAFVVAMQIFGQDEELGWRCLPLILDMKLVDKTIKKQPKFRLPDYKGYQAGDDIVRMIKSSGFQVDKTYAGNSYVLGTSVEDGYKLPDLPYRYYTIEKFHPNKDQKKVFCNTSGVASGTAPYVLSVNSSGVWKVLKASSMFVGTQDPPKDDGDDL